MLIFDNILEQLEKELKQLETNRKQGWANLIAYGEPEDRKIGEINFDVPGQDEIQKNEEIIKIEHILFGLNYYGLSEFLTDEDINELKRLYSIKEDLKSKLDVQKQEADSYKIILNIIKKYQEEHFQEDVEITPSVWKLLKKNKTENEQKEEKLRTQIQKVQGKIQNKAFIINSYIEKILLSEYEKPEIKCQYTDFKDYVMSLVNKEKTYTRTLK